MTVARLVTRSVENPNVPLTSVALAEWLAGGKTDAGVSVNERKVYGLPAYYRAVSVLAGMFAGLPLHVYRNGTRERVRARTVLDNPNPIQTPFEFWQTMYANAISWGNGFGRKVRNGADVVTEVWPLHPSRVRVELVEGRDGIPTKLFLVQTKAGESRLTGWEIMHLPYLSIDGVSGIRPLEAFRTSLGIGLAAEQTAARFYGSGARLSGILSSKQKLTEESAERLKTRWKQRMAGPDNAGDIAVLDNDTTFQPLSIPPQDAELLSSRRWTVSEVARMVGLPPHLLADVEKSTSWGTGIEQQNIGLVIYTAKPWLQMGEQRVTRELLPGGWTSGSWFAEYALEGLLRGDSQARAAFYAQMIQWGVLSRNEVRILENREPAEGLDEFLTPSNMVLVSVDGSIQSLAGNALAGEQGGTDAPSGS